MKIGVCVTKTNSLNHLKRYICQNDDIVLANAK